jgi:hypothetical protein
LSEGTFILPRPGGYGLELSFLPGTTLVDVPYSLVREKAAKVLSEDMLQKFRELETLIKETQALLSQMPAATLGQRLKRAEPEALLNVLNTYKRIHLKVPRKLAAKELAQKAYRQYCDWLNCQLAGLRKSLPQTKYKDIGAYFKKQFGDPRYLGYPIQKLIPFDIRVEAERSVQGKLKEIYEERVPAGLRKYVTYRPQSHFFALPHAEYSLEWDIPCLDFGFELYLVVELELLEVEEAEDAFYGYQFTIRFTGDTLGRVHNIFQPQPPLFFWQTVPLSLIQGLLAGELIPKGAKVLYADSGATQYETEGFEVIIPEDFATYLTEVGKKGGLAKFGIIEEKTATIIEKLSIDQLAGAEGSEIDKVIAKLVELGQTEASAKKLVETTNLPKNATAEEIIKIILVKSYPDSME